MGQAFVANAQAPEGVVQPGEGPLDHPALSNQRAVDHVGTPAPAAAPEEDALWDMRANLALVENRPEGATVIAFVGNQAARAVPGADPQSIERGDGAAQIMMRRRHNRQRQRHAVGVNDQRTLRAVETGLARGADGSAPFFAGTRLASSIAWSS